MKKLLSSLLLLPLLAQAAPQFKDYPVDVYQGARHKAVIDSKNKDFRTRFRETDKMPIDFAGHYVTNMYGCGAGCVGMLWVDAQTGKGRFFEPNNFIGCYTEAGYIDSELYTRPNSRLFIAAGTIDGEEVGNDQCLIRYYVEDNGKLKLIETQPFVKKGE